MMMSLTVWLTACRGGLFDMVLKNLGFFKHLKSPNFGLKNKNLMSDLSF